MELLNTWHWKTSVPVCGLFMLKHCRGLLKSTCKTAYTEKGLLDFSLNGVESANSENPINH